MTESGRHRALTSAWGRLVLSACLLAWLNVAVQPCLMAMELTPDAGVSMHEAAGHAEHAADRDVGEECGHCPPLSGHQGALCSTSSASDCGVSPDYNADKRQAKPKLKDLAEPLAMPDLPESSTLALATTTLSLIDQGQLKFAQGPSLNIRYCVYLK